MGKELSPGEREKILMAVKELDVNSSLHINECEKVLNFSPILREYERNKRRFGSDGLPRVERKSTATCGQYAHPEPTGSDEV